MLFIHTIDKVLDNSKTQTRRIKKEGHFLTEIDNGMAVYSGNEDKSRRIYEVGKSYAVQPGRGKKSVARIKIINIGKEDVRYISDEDVKAEGFPDAFEFIRTWVSMHDKVAHKQQYWGTKSILERPTEYYQAWVLTFRLEQS